MTPLRLSISLLLGLALSSLFQSVYAEIEKIQPNILLLVADDLGYGEVGAYGQDKIRTPVIDHLAEKGMLFTQFYAGSPVCSPSRATLMTGKHTGHSSVRGNAGYYGEQKWDRVPLSKEEVTLAELLHNVGYETAFIGKWHLDYPDDFSTWAFSRGFDFAIQPNWTARFGELEFDEDVHYYGNQVRSVTYDPNEYDSIDAFRTDLILEYLERRTDSKPLFLLMSYRAPHARESYIRDRELYGEFDWPEVERRHAAKITILDQQIGRLLAHFEEQGELENTLVLFTSDNGPHSEMGHDFNFFNSSGGLRGYKRDLYEGGIRVPFIAYWPGKIAPGEHSSHIASITDIMATCADLAGLKSGYEDGISFLPELRGEVQADHPYLYWEVQLDGWWQALPCGGFRQALRMGSWKAVRYGADNPIELFDLSLDPKETFNLASEKPELITQVKSIFEQARTSNSYFPFAGIKSAKKASESSISYLH